ncbi:helix-turn-helix domain-containing protein [Pseudomonas silvicola]|nr:helix-turn-helix domain-containing protein [Pseudomonas silvicola]
MPVKQPSPRHIGRQLAKFRLARNLTQEEVGVRLDIGAEAVSRLERGQVDLSVAKLLQLADIFQCPAAELLMAISTRTQDQAQVITALLDKLSDENRQFTLEMLERMAAHLAPK